jgi:hypothetical protein
LARYSIFGERRFVNDHIGHQKTFTISRMISGVLLSHGCNQASKTGAQAIDEEQISQYHC